jgi:hypothetical protein
MELVEDDEGRMALAPATPSATKKKGNDAQIEPEKQASLKLR